jgi:hypothetical protein
MVYGKSMMMNGLLLIDDDGFVIKVCFYMSQIFFRCLIELTKTKFCDSVTPRSVCIEFTKTKFW